MKYQLKTGDSSEVLKNIPDNSIDSIVTDPPYGISFLGKDWDSKKASETTSKMVALQNLPSGMKHTSLADDIEFQNWLKTIFTECFRVLKPGGHMLAFSAARTYHHTAMAAQLSGFEIRDQIMWIYGSGFPKSQDVGRSIDRAAGKKDTNYGTTNNNKTPGGINLSFTENSLGGGRRCNKCKKDHTTVYNCKDDNCGLKYTPQTEEGKEWSGWGTQLKPAHEPIVMARKPMKNSVMKNVQEYKTGALNIDECRVGDEKIVTKGGWTEGHDWKSRTTYNEINEEHQGRFPANVIGEIEEQYQKYFYCPKISRDERHIGNEMPDPIKGYSPGEVKNHPLWDPSIGNNVQRLKHKIMEHNKTIGKEHIVEGPVGNNHPTVKPVALMEYLIKLVTPKNGTVLDPFNGSGSTGMAAVGLGFNYIGIDLSEDYINISRKRIEAWDKLKNPNNFNDLFDSE